MKYLKMLFNWIAKHKLVFGIISLGVLVAVPCWFYFRKFSGYDFSDDPGKWGVFGDYIGGTLNPIISLASFLVLSYLTYQVSKQSTDENRDLILQQRRLKGYEELTECFARLLEAKLEVNRKELMNKIWFSTRDTEAAKEGAFDYFRELANHSIMYTDVYNRLTLIKMNYYGFFDYKFKGDYDEVLQILKDEALKGKKLFETMGKKEVPDGEDFESNKDLPQKLGTIIVTIRNEIKILK
jgi:hypothetical protein